MPDPIWDAIAKEQQAGTVPDALVSPPVDVPEAPAGADVAHPSDPIWADIKKEQDNELDIQAQAAEYKAANDSAEPNKRGEVLRYAAATGLHPNFVETNLEEVKKRADAAGINWTEVAYRQPALVSLMQDNPAIAPIVKDDVADLGGIEWAIAGPLAALRDAVGEQVTTGRQFAEAQGFGSPENRQRIAELEGQLAGKDYGANNWFTKGVIGAFKMGPYLVGDTLSRAAGAGIGVAIGGGGGAAGGGAAGAPAAGVGAAPGALGGGVVGGAGGGLIGQYVGSGLFNYYEALGPLYWRLSKLKGADGKPIDPEVARAFAQSGAVMTGVLMAGFMGKVGGNLPGVKQMLAKVSGNALEETLVKASVGQAVKKGALSFGQHWLMGASMMAASSAISATTEEGAQLDVAPAIADLVRSGQYGPAAYLGASHLDQTALARIAENTKAGFVDALESMWLISALGPGREMQKDVGRAKASADSSMQLEAMTESARASKLLERFPQGFRDFVKRSTEVDGAVKTVFHPLDEWISYWQKEKIDPAEMAAHVMDDGGKGYASTPHGGDLAIPVEAWLTKLGKTEHTAKLLDIAKVRPEESTPRQAKADQLALQAAMETEAKSRKDEIDADKKAISKLIVEQAVAAKIAPDEAAAVAKLMVADFASMAVRLSVGGQKVTVREAAARGSLGRLRFSGPGGETASDAVRQRLHAYLTPDSDALINDRLEGMSMQARARELFIDPNTGLHNEKAFRELPAPADKPVVAHFSVEGIKYLNDSVGHDRADLLYRAVANALHAIDPQAAKVGGDFAIHVKDQAEADAVAAKVNASLPADLQGFKVTTATGPTVEKAATAHTTAKDAAVAAGARANPRPLGPIDARGNQTFLAPEKPRGLAGDAKSLAFPEGRVATDVHPDLQKRIAGLSKADYFNEAYRDQRTGLYTALGWNAIPRKAHVAALDIVGMKAAIDLYSEKHGDNMVEALGRVAKAIGGQGFDFSRLHGDEFAAQHADRSTLDRFMLALENAMRLYPLAPEGGEGDKPESVRVEFRYGLGERSYEAADLDLNRRKEAERAAKPVAGDFPFGSEGQPQSAAADVAGGGSRPHGSEGVVGGEGRGAAGGVQEARPDTVADVVAAAENREPKNRQQMLDWVAFAQTDGTGPAPHIDPDLYRQLLARWGPLVADPRGVNFDPTGSRLVYETSSLAPQQGNGENGGHLWIANHPDEAYHLTPEQRLDVEQGFDLARGGTRKRGSMFQEPIAVTSVEGSPVTLHAGDPNAPRGEIQLQLDPGGTPRAFNVRILNGDRSTFLHETAHFLSWSLHDIATSDIATPELRDDYAKLLKYAGFASPEARLENQLKHQTLSGRKDLGPADLAYRRKLAAGEEKISHAWEQYMLEGKAPSAALARVFSKFRGWLLRIYKGVAGIAQQYEQNYGQPLELSDEVRGVFDRMLADDEAIRQAQRDQGKPAGPEPLVTVMTAAEAEAYQQLLADARAHAEQELAKRSAELKKNEVEQTRAQIRTEVTKDIDSKPVNAAMRYLQHGELPDGQGGALPEVPAPLRDPTTGLTFKLNKEKFIEEFGEGVAALMPPSVFSKVKGGGKQAEQLAPLLGFNDGAGLVDALRNAEPRDRAIQKQTQDRLDAEYGPALQANAAAAMDAVHNDAAAKATIAELRAAAKAINPGAARKARTIDLDALKATAERLVAGQKVSELDPDKYAATERKLALKAAELWGAGKKEESYSLRENKLFNELLYRAAKDAQDHLDRVRQSLEAVGETQRAKLGLADPSYRDAHDALLEAVGIREGKAPTGALEAMLAKAGLDDAGIDFDVDAVRELLTNPLPWEDLTVDQARMVDDAAANIRHVARDALEVIVDGKRAEKVGYLKEVFARVASVRPPQPRDAFSKTLASNRDKARGLRRGAAALLENMETWAHMLDGGSSGPARKIFVEGQRAARDREVELSKKVLDVIREKWGNVPKDIRKLKDQQVSVEGILPIPGDFRPVVSRDTLWMLFLNWGNEGNRQRIRDGNKWTDDGVQKALNLLSKPETDFLQGVLEAVGSLGPAIQEAHERRTGLKLNMVEAAKFTVNGTEYEGGYFPLRYDARGQASERIREGKEIRDIFASNYVRAATAHGFTEKRVQKVNRAVALDWGVVQAHLAQVVHDLSYGDWVRQTASILTDKGSNKPGEERPSFTAVAEKFLGVERSKELMPWLGDVANSRVDSASGHQSGFLRTLGSFGQGVVSRAVMGLNLASLARHSFDPYSLMGDSESIGPQRIAAAYLKVVNPANWDAPLYKTSKALAHHESLLSDNMRNELARIGPGGNGPVLHAIDAVLFAAHGWVHHFTARVCFRAAYDYALAHGATPEEASKHGDDVVERALPSGDIAEKPPILRQKSAIAGAAIFYGYASRMHNLRARSFDDAWRAWNAGDATAGTKAEAIATVAAKWLAQGAVSAMGLYLAGRGLKKDDEENAPEWIGKELLYSPLDDVAIIGPPLKKALTGHKPNVATAPGLAFMQTSLEKLADVMKESKGDKTSEEKAWLAVQVFLSSLGPANAVKRATNSLQNDNPRNVADVAAGLLYGPKKNRSISPLTQLGDLIESR